MTERERQILALIQKNPLISQQELADMLGISRSAAAGHVMNLTNKGHIRGKGYILNETPYIVVIGGANIDIQGIAESSWYSGDSNPGEIRTSLGGVGRNIAENLARLSIDTRLISAVGNDEYGNMLLKETQATGVDISACLVSQNHRTSTYLSVMNQTGELESAISDMRVLKSLTPDRVSSNESLIRNAALLIVDTNLESNLIDYIFNYFADRPILFDTVSVVKSRKIAKYLGKIHTLKPNRAEAEALSGITIDSEENAILAAEWFIAKGVNQLFLSLGADGLLYADELKHGILRPPKTDVVSVAGAGDALMAGVAYGMIQNHPVDKTAMYAMAASIATIKHTNTNNPNLTSTTLENSIQELLC
ncbi:PfkB family carbohydrate kinase [Algicola sagamiensis]|uniref:PfkB family carbohydrate kinase n=1 Tax=Algicola sagamiensis TaxID=163869 RepID=UPI00037147FA|nr:PfkB family carbohydrate kinase [Algicola sagamiensis]